MKCILCESRTTVLESRSYSYDGNVTRRRRLCLNEECKHRFTTYEGPSSKSRPLKPSEVKLIDHSLRDVDEAMDALLSATRHCKLISRSLLDKCTY